ncbi:hypothetical protein PAUR_b0102 [Pseudoalteromonas aurantia 208]|uniref:OmpR/PhoB-type domain-containing protein n=2 Tax=Pseudoalteromonas aurantia TaxID=43654 RepID=A0ABR9EGL9_9GAMM|nr:hypothetical protein [Pseudoalteromonas aurantia 208]
MPSTEHPFLDHFTMNQWVVDCKKLTAVHANKKVRLEPKAALILQYMAARPGQIINREELFNQFWSNQVVTEDALNRVISSLRKAFDDNLSEPQYIATIRKTGYRLVAEVAPLPSGSKYAKRRVISSISFFLIILFTFPLITRIVSTTEPTISMGSMQRLTYNTDLKLMPNLSEDGTHLTYIESDIGEMDTIVLMTVKNQRKEHFSAYGYEFMHPVITAKTNSVLALTRKNHAHSISLIDLSNDTIKHIVELRGESYGLNHHIKNKTLVFTQEHINSKTHRLTIYDALIDLIEPLSTPPRGLTDKYPIFSPSGLKIAYIRSKASSDHALFTVDLDGNETQLSNYQTTISGYDWVDDEHLLYANEQGVHLLALTGETKTISAPLPTNILSNLQISSNTGTLLFSLQQTNLKGVALDLTQPKKALPLTASNSNDSELSISPDAKKMGFVSTRKGYKTLWVRGNNHLSSINNSKFDDIYDLVWSTDNQRIAATVKQSSKYGIAIYHVELDNLHVTWLSSDPVHVIGWNKHNRVLYAQRHHLHWRLASYNSATSAHSYYPAINVYQGRLLPDKKSLLYIDAVTRTLWQWDFNNKPKKIPIPKQMTLDRNWDVDLHGIYYIDTNGIVKYYKMDNGEIKSIMDHPYTFSFQSRPQVRLHGFIGANKTVTNNDFWLSAITL